jgi:hypothetical protein
MQDLLPVHQERMLSTRLLPWLRGEAIDGPVPSAFWATYVFTEATRRGQSWRMAGGWTPGGMTWRGRGDGSGQPSAKPIPSTRPSPRPVVAWVTAFVLVRQVARTTTG